MKMGLEQKPTTNASRTSKFAAFITVMILLLCCGGLVRIELVANARVEKLQAKIRTMHASFEEQTKHAEKSNQYGHACEHGECVQKEENSQTTYHAKRFRRDLPAVLMLLNQTLEILKMEMSRRICQKVQKAVLTKKEFHQSVNQSETKLESEMYVKIRQEANKRIWYGIPGPLGARGPPGRKGDRGLTGPKGSKGDSGIIGLPGVEGDTGQPGSKGMKGDVGPRGFKGPKGEKGQDGDPGGERGDSGDSGVRGDKGRKGPRGFPGPHGLSGVPGFKGLPGAPGIRGMRGAPGDCSNVC